MTPPGPAGVAPGCSPTWRRWSTRAAASWRPRWTRAACAATTRALLLLAAYSMVTGLATEVEVLRAFGEEPTLASLVRRRDELLSLLRAALAPDVVTPDVAVTPSRHSRLAPSGGRGHPEGLEARPGPRRPSSRRRAGP